MNLNKDELKSFVKFMEELDNAHPNNDDVIVDVRLISKESWWQGSLIQTARYNTKQTDGDKVKISKIDLRSYILFVDDLERSLSVGERIDVVSLSYWQTYQTEQKRIEIAKFYGERKKYYALEHEDYYALKEKDQAKRIERLAKEREKVAKEREKEFAEEIVRCRIVSRENNDVKTDGNISCTLVDNWILELAYGLLFNDLSGVFYENLGGSKMREIMGERWSRNALMWDSELVENALTALLHTLDLLVVNDNLVYDSEYSFTWKRYVGHYSQLMSLFREVRLSNNTKIDILQRSGAALKLKEETRFFHDILNDIDVVGTKTKKWGINDDGVNTGALYYLSLSRFLGVYYWPSPKRAHYLQEHLYEQFADNFTLQFRDYVDENLRQITQDILKPLKSGSFLQFPGFSSTIVSSCNDTQSVLPTLLQVRGSSAGIKFRQWLRDMDKALQSGDLDYVARELKQVRDVISEVRRDLGIDEKKGQTFEIQIGLSPGLTLGADVLKSISDYFRPTPLHLVFIKQHFSRYLKNTNMRTNLKRLFPQIR